MTTAISMGGEAPSDAGGTSGTGGYTYIETYSAANASGVITQVQLRCDVTPSAFYIGIFTKGTGNYYTCKAWSDDLSGSITADTNITINGLNLPVTSGDYLGFYCATDNVLERNTNGGSGIYKRSGKVTIDESVEYTSESSGKLDFMAYGTTRPAAPTSVNASETLQDKVVVRWIDSADATYYWIYRGATYLNSVNSAVQTYTDTGGTAPALSVGATVASDGTLIDKIALSLASVPVAGYTSYSYGIYGVIYHNGTYVKSATQPTDTGFRKAVDRLNVPNSDFEMWTGGASAVPDSWTGYGAYTVARESTIKHGGSYACKLVGTGSAGKWGEIHQAIHTLDGRTIDYYKGKPVTIGVWVYATVANKVFIQISDSTGAYANAYHSGSGSWEFLVCTLPSVNNSATTLTIYMAVLDTNTGYFDDVVVACSNAESDGSGDLQLIINYLWQRSAADSDASYSDISGATNNTHNDVAVPVNGEGRYYRCKISASNMSDIYSAVNRGYLGFIPKITHL